MRDLKDSKGKAIIETRINKLRRGIVGEMDDVGDGIIELIITFGPGYRVYCVDDGTKVLLLWVGRKKTQKKDIKRAKLYWKEYNS